MDIPSTFSQFGHSPCFVEKITDLGIYFGTSVKKFELILYLCTMFSCEILIFQ